MKVKGELNVTKDDKKIFTKKQKNIIMNKKNNLLDQIPKLKKAFKLMEER